MSKDEVMVLLVDLKNRHQISDSVFTMQTTSLSVDEPLNVLASTWMLTLGFNNPFKPVEVGEA